MQSDELKTAISAECSKLMQQCHRGTAEGRYVTAGDSEREAIAEFSRFFVDDFFKAACFGRRDLLSGNKFALVEHSCEWIVKGIK
jgi:CRISPR-associated protein Csc3